MPKRKKKEYIKKLKIIFREKLINFYYIIIIYIPFSFSFIKYKQRKIDIHDSLVHLKVKRIGYNQILSSQFGVSPTKIYINSIVQENLNRNPKLTEPENNITISWAVDLDSTT